MIHMPDARLRPHYFLFCGSILVYVVCLLFRQAWLAAGLCALGVLMVYLATRQAPERQVGKLESLAYIVVMTLFFFATKITIPLIRPGIKYDSLLQAIDERWFFPVENWVATLSTPWFTDLLTFCYLLYGPMMYTCLIYFGFFRRDLSLPYYSGIFTIFGLGFIGYLLVPAEGPHFARGAEVMPLLASGPFHSFADPMIKDGCTRSDVFPSLHVSVSLFTLYFLGRNTPRLFLFWVVPVTLLCVATLFLFYHYQIDVLVALLVLLPASLLCSRMTRLRLQSLSPLFRR